MGWVGKIFGNAFRIFEGNLAYQRAFERLYELSLNGMNFGRGDEIEYSGELEVMRYVFSRLKRANKRVLIFDVGANVGKYTMALLSAAQVENIVVYAFEPSQETYKRLRENVRELHDVYTFNLGLSDANTTRKLYTDMTLSGLASVYHRKLESRSIVMNKVENVSLQTLDDFCREHGVGEVDFLKLDVEGHELSVLKGAEEMISRGKIHFIQFEFGGCNIDSRTYFKDFFDLLSVKYTLGRIVRDGICPIRQYRESYEVFTTVNYLAELKEK